ncbi:MAG: replication-associated recombination protein A, partial [bacterium]
IESVSQTAKIRYDRLGDMHYDVISAFIKSVRGSNPDAAIYWLTLMLNAGEDPRFISRRLVILASEDIGLADRHALPIAMAAAHAVEFIGLPECQLNLAHATLYLATAPKSNSATIAIMKARTDIEKGEILEVPDHLKDSNYPGAKQLGHGTGYKYAHDYPEHFVDQSYLPKPKKYYTPSSSGYEAKIAAFLAHLSSLRKK